VKIARALISSGALALVVLLAQSGAVAANGVGDLYVASSAGVLEVHVKTSTVVSTISILPAPQALAFAPDGRTLFVGSGGDHLSPIDIGTLEVGDAIAMPGPVSALAYPQGAILVGSMPTRRTLAFVHFPGASASESAELPGPGNLLAGDRHDPRVAVAEAGKGWLDIVDPATSTLKTATVTGEIRALAIDRGSGAVLVATTNPNALTRIDLTSLAVTWTAALSGVPTAVAPLTGSVIVSIGTGLWRISGNAAVKWATARQSVLALAGSDEGAILHVEEKNGVEVFSAAGTLQRTLELSADRAPVAMAAVPAGSSLATGTTPGAAAAATPTGHTAASITSGKPPSTSTLMDSVSSIVSEGPVQGAVAVGLVILVGYWLLVHWYDRRGRQTR
jgi:DNA-binding beta-propeller fold protein YncE